MVDVLVDARNGAGGYNGAGGFRWMPLSDLEIRRLPIKEKRYKRSAGDGLNVIVEPLKNKKGSGGKSFVGFMRFPASRKGKKIDVRIGVYGKGYGKFSLKAARDEWERLRSWSKENGRDPRELQKEEKRILLGQSSNKLNELIRLDELIHLYFEKSTNRPTTISDNRNKFNNQVVPFLGASTPVKFLGWDYKYQGRTGRQAVLSITDKIENRNSPIQARKVLGLMRGLFDFAIERGYMERGQNPALAAKSVGIGHKEKHYPCLSWSEVPQLLEDLNENKANGSEVVIAAIKFDLMTFVRVGSLVPMKWPELDYENDLWKIPAIRMKAGKEHLVPLTDPIKELLEHLRKFNGDEEYVFWSPRGRSKPYIDESALNQHLKRLGYGGRQTAHGLRSLPATAGQEVLKVPYEVIQRQLAHAVGNKIRQAYDRSQMLEERREFMKDWCDELVNQGLKI